MAVVVVTKVVPNRPGLASILRGVPLEAELRRRAEMIAKAADGATGRPGDHLVDSDVGRTRARAAVITDTWNARWREARQRTLTSSVDAARA